MDLLALDRQLCFALSAASRSVVSVYKPVLDELGLTHPQYLVMLAIWEQEPRSAGELAHALRLDPATLTPILRRLEEIGYLTRRRSADDERRMEVTATDAGRALRDQAEAVPPAVLSRLGVPVERLEAIRDDLIALLDAADRATAND